MTPNTHSAWVLVLATTRVRFVVKTCARNHHVIMQMLSCKQWGAHRGMWRIASFFHPSLASRLNLSSPVSCRETRSEPSTCSRLLLTTHSNLSPYVPHRTDWLCVQDAMVTHLLAILRRHGPYALESKQNSDKNQGSSAMEMACMSPMSPIRPAHQHFLIHRPH